jgi:hypothetical protein
MTFSPDLVRADAAKNKSSSAFHATINANGLYNTQQFILRLSPNVHKKLATLPIGITTNEKIGLEGAQAMSTYLHETIHWWQHIGTTYGFILSLNYPVQSHCTHVDLKKLVGEDGFKKSVYLQAIDLSKHGPKGPGTVTGRAHSIINNHFDLLAFRAFTLGPEAAQSVSRHDLFENVGHAFYMTYGHTLIQLASSVDRDFNVIPHPKEWADGFGALRERKVQGHYYGSPIKLYPIGAREIFEGQAQFSQIQYLSQACGHSLGWDDYRNLGMLTGVYLKAFEEFLRFTESEWPAHINDPIVGLFLLVCDLAINPASGFPAPVQPNFETFIDDVNPGVRFCHFCRLIARKFPQMKNAIRTHSRSEYEYVTEELCAAAKEGSPLQIAKVFSNWFNKTGPLSKLRIEYETYVFRPENYVLRHLFAHFLAFQEDKLKRPEFFCWPGAWTAGDRVTTEEVALFDKQGALFIDRELEDGVFPRIQSGRDNATVEAAFNNFYHNQAIYELTNQWISTTGPFSYDFELLASSATGDVKSFLRNRFKAAFDLDPESVRILIPTA